MYSDKIEIFKDVKLKKPRLIMGFSGWMDGGNVSTSTIKYLIEKFNADRLGCINPKGFYIFNIPASMELSAYFRPHVEIEDGSILALDMPKNDFFVSQEQNLILFNGSEPNINWVEYTDCLLEICEKFDVGSLYFIGSFAGLVPHTRKPRIFCTVSDPEWKNNFDRFGLRHSRYQGPSSISTYITTAAAEKQLLMLTLAAEIPAYIQGHNPMCINIVIKTLSAMLELGIEHDDLIQISDEFERKVSEVVLNHDELNTYIKRLEQDYDNEVFDTEMGDMKQWLQEQGIRVD